MSSSATSGIGIAMTDLFISAAAALLLVLAILKPQPPTPLPIQSNAFVYCPVEVKAGPPSYRLQNTPDGTGEFVDVTDPDMLHDALTAIGINGQLMVTLSIVGAPERPLTGTCLRDFTISFVRKANTATSALTGEDATQRPPILSSSLGRNLETVGQP